MAKSVKQPRTFRDLPPERRHNAVVHEIEDEKQTDRAVAIVGAAYVDLVLRDAITTRFVITDTKLMNEIFEDRGPLQDFGARIKAAYALGIYGKAAFSDLGKITQIRNAFAHSADALDFNQQDVTRICQSLWYPQKIQYTGRAAPATPRLIYTRAIALITDLLHSDRLRRKKGMDGEAILMAPGN